MTQGLKHGDRVMVTIEVPAIINAETNERAPTGNWWVNIDGRIGCTSVHEDRIRRVADGELKPPA